MTARADLLAAARSPLAMRALPWLLALVCAFLALRGCANKPEPAPGIDQKLAAALERFTAHLAADSIQRQRDSVERDSLLRTAANANRAAAAAERAATELGQRADAAAAAGDVRGAYLARTEERDALQREVGAQVTEIAAATGRAVLAEEGQRRAEAQLDTARRVLIPGLEEEIAKANQRTKDAAADACSVGPAWARIRCPTRTASAAGGAVLGALLVVIVGHAAH